jgi:hypothetical protein
MKHIKIYFSIIAVFFCITQAALSQETVPGNWGKGSNETDPVFVQEKLPADIIQRLGNNELLSNTEMRVQLNNEIDRILGAVTGEDRFGITKTSVITSSFNQPPFSPDWYTSDVLVHSGSVASAGGYRQLDMKQGEDGWLYMCVNKAGTPGQFSIYMSSNGGATWPGVINYSAGSSYIHNISMLVESRNNAVLDSTRLLVYFTYSASVNGDNASLYMLNVKRTGVGGIVFPIGSPAGGNKYEYVSACSDGMYYAAPTYMHAVVREATNAGVQVGIRHFRTTNWGVTNTSALLSTGYNDYYPSAAFSRENGTNDSIYIAVERRLTATEYELRLLTTHEVPNSNHRTYYITSAVSGIKYERPAITIVQQNINVPRKILVTCTRNRNPRYNYSSNSGSTWVIDQLLGPNSAQVADYTTCNSDSLTSGGQNVIMGYVTDDGDSVNVKQLNVPPTAIYSYYKRNSNQSSGVVAPVCVIRKVGSTKYAAFGYPGFGPTNVYFNSEQLFTGVEPVNNIVPDKYEMGQNYPNPFNPTTNINFSIPKAGFVKITVFDILGKEAAVLVNENLTAGSYKADFNASALSSGVYFYKIEADGFSDIKKMMLVK